MGEPVSDGVDEDASHIVGGGQFGVAPQRAANGGVEKYAVGKCSEQAGCLKASESEVNDVISFIAVDLPHHLSEQGFVDQLLVQAQQGKYRSDAGVVEAG